MRLRGLFCAIDGLSLWSNTIMPPILSQKFSELYPYAFNCPPIMHPQVEYIGRKVSAMAQYLSARSKLLRDQPILPLLLRLEVVEKD
jgi:hypothetical protein